MSHDLVQAVPLDVGYRNLASKPPGSALGVVCAICLWLLAARVRAIRGGQMSDNDRIVFDNVSRFYGEVLGVNRVTLSIPPGITSLVGPNGSGKTTLMNLMTGLVRPTRGAISVLGISPDRSGEAVPRVRLLPRSSIRFRAA